MKKDHVIFCCSTRKTTVGENKIWSDII